MRKQFRWAMLAVLSCLVCGLASQHAGAISPSVVISQVQLGNLASATNEFIELHNNAPSDSEITNWCLYYASSTSTINGSRLTCFVPDNVSLHLYLPSHAFAFTISTALATSLPTLGSDLLFSATLSGTAGHVRLIDEQGSEIDKLGWGAAASPETLAVVTAPAGKVLQRKAATTDTLQDTDNNSLDFELALPRTTYAYGAIYEVQDLCMNITGIQTSIPTDYTIDDAGNCLPPPVDVCVNLDGLQISVPPGYGLDDAGLCQPDACKNITGLQLVIPDGQEFDLDGNCVNHDFCVNLSGIQDTIPVGYLVNTEDICLLDLPAVKINELLPNAIGTDDGNEFVELYNPNDLAIDLSLYLLRVGIDTPKLYEFPVGSIVEPHGYMTFSNDNIAFTLVNSTSQVGLIGIDGQTIDESPVYSNPYDGMAWALINGTWQYTNQPTPGAANLASTINVDDVEEVVTGLKPCAPNQYRNPETNRCRLLVTVGSTLTPCKDGQYRSEETNRCRSIATDAEVLGACAEGQERNPDTNRCRNVVGNIPDAGFAVEPVASSGGGFAGWWALGGVATGALGYAGWEWRQEFLVLIRKLGSFLHLRK